jgi:uroporphyrinogen-III synthase
MRVLVTRPGPDGAATARRLAEAGHEPVLAPLLEIVAQMDASFDLAGVQAVLITSANGARALGGATGRRDLPVFAVGAASTAAARDAGFERIESADGDVAALAALVRARLDPAAGRLVHVAGSVTAGDLSGDLTAAGFDVTRAVVYWAEPAKILPAPAADGLREGTLDAALFFSPRTAESFVALVDAAGLADACKGLVACCLSQAVADRLAPLTLGSLQVAERPDQAALLALLNG